MDGDRLEGKKAGLGLERPNDRCRKTGYRRPQVHGTTGDLGNVNSLVFIFICAVHFRFHVHYALEASGLIDEWCAVLCCGNQVSKADVLRDEVKIFYELKVR